VHAPLRNACLAAALALAQSAPGPGAAPALAAAARDFRASLDEARRSRASFTFDDAGRLDWHYVPKDRPGLPLGDLDVDQARSFRSLLDATLSDAGLAKVDGVIRLEGVLRELESSAARDPKRYAIRLFGTPGAEEPWGFQLEGHHLSLNLAAAGGRVAVTPLFLGANPAEVTEGPHKGLRVLAEEEDLAVALAVSLDARQRALGVRADDVPADVILGPGRAASFLEPPGIAASELDEAQRALLARLVALYPGDLEAGLRGDALDRARAPAELHFLWVGATDRGRPHYWRVQGAGFAIELDDVQGGANHVHTLWRDLHDDFGEDLFRL